MVVTDKTYEVTGVLAPDATGIYEVAGAHSSRGYFARTPNLWYLWWLPPNSWVISIEVGAVGDTFWTKVGWDPVGDYTPVGGAGGIATIEED